MILDEIKRREGRLIFDPGFAPFFSNFSLVRDRFSRRPRMDKKPKIVHHPVRNLIYGELVHQKKKKHLEIQQAGRQPVRLSFGKCLLFGMIFLLLFVIKIRVVSFQRHEGRMGAFLYDTTFIQHDDLIKFK